MWKKMMISSVMLVAIIAIAVSGCRRTPEERAEHVVEHIADELEMTEEQTAKLNVIKDELMAKRTEMKELHNSIYEEVVSQMEKEEIDQDSLDALLKGHQEKLNELTQLITTQFAAFHGILTPEQRAVVIEKMSEFKERHDRWHQ